jgi:hypothetical protein
VHTNWSDKLFLTLQVPFRRVLKMIFVAEFLSYDGLYKITLLSQREIFNLVYQNYTTAITFKTYVTIVLTL